MNTSSPSVPAAPERPESRRGWWQWWYLVPLLLVSSTGLAAGLLPIPYYSIAPGSILSADGFIDVDDTRVHPADGEIYLATVELRHVTMLEAVRGWLDPTIDVVEQESVLPPEISPGRLRQFNRDLMELSQRSALVVAFQELGYDVVQYRGARVAQVVAGPSDGILAEGETIVGFDGRPLSTVQELLDALASRRPGDVVTLTVDDVEDARRQVEVTLGEHPDEPGRAFLGITLFDRVELDLPFEVDIESSSIGGPSAGLAFTLKILDELTEGELTGGLRVVATGTIELDGTVGSVGGVAQKAVAVTRAGADVFLVPRSEEEVARRHAGDDVRVEGVGTLADALRILAGAGGNGLALPRRGGEEA